MTKEKGGKKLGLLPRLGIGIVAGIILGFLVPAPVMAVINTIREVLGSLIFFVVPLVIFGFIAPAICGLKANAGKMLGVYLGLSYSSALGASLFSAAAGYIIIPHLHIPDAVSQLKEVPTTAFELSLPPVMPVMTALVMAILVGISVIWTKSETMEKLLNEFQSMVLGIVNKVIVPLLPLFILTTFTELAYTGSLSRQLPVFLKVIVIVLVGHMIWLTLLYLIGGAVSKKNPLEVLKHYGPAYMTAVVTMSSAATLPVSLRCAHKSKVLPSRVGFCNSPGSDYSPLRFRAYGNIFCHDHFPDALRGHALCGNHGSLFPPFWYFCRRSPRCARRNGYGLFGHRYWYSGIQ